MQRIFNNQSPVWVILMGWVAVVSAPLANANFEEQISAAEMVFESAQGESSAALLLGTEIKGEINGLIAKITLRQRFQNSSSQWVNGQYVFPMPEQSAVDSLTLETGGRVIRGVVKEKQQARREFEAAKVSGKKVGLMQQNRPNLFSMSLANIAPNAEVIAEITWIETAGFDGGLFSLRLPTTLTPRFIPGKNLVADSNISETGEIEPIVIDGMSGWSKKN